MSDLLETVCGKAREIADIIEAACLEDQISALNAARHELHRVSPFRDEPIDLVIWTPAAKVVANDYNPNMVAPPEMRLLEISIIADGYTQPIVTHAQGGEKLVVDGFHRNRVGKENPEVRRRIHDHLPVVQIRASQADDTARMASTIRHNRARGKHAVEPMQGIVAYLAKKGWDDAKIGLQIGMEPDEVLRFKQISGLTELFADRDFSEAWDVA